MLIRAPYLWATWRIIDLDHHIQLSCYFCFLLLLFYKNQELLLPLCYCSQSGHHQKDRLIFFSFHVQMKTKTALWTTGTATIAVKPVTASPLHTTARPSQTPPSTSIPSATSTAAPEAYLTHALATARTWTTTIRGLSGVCLFQCS